MVWDVSFTCDVCGTTKGDANHWWMLSHADCACDEDDQVPQRFSVMPWSASQSRNPEMRHLCGKGCAIQALERFMTQRPLIGVEAEDSSREDEGDSVPPSPGMPHTSTLDRSAVI